MATSGVGDGFNSSGLFGAGHNDEQLDRRGHGTHRGGPSPELPHNRVEKRSGSLRGGELMKRLLLLLPLVLTACGGAADITTTEPFQVTCVDTWEDGSQTDKWFIDPTLDKAALKWSYEDKTGEQEQEVISVSPKKIVVGPEWGYIPEKNDPPKELAVFDRDLYTIDRFSGEMTRHSFTATARDFPSKFFMGRKVSPRKGETYKCEKPTRG